ncbi:MAG: hypothetical protein JWP74_3030 [Marmoricola sp.]|nr:hypothetical protein [Marmoricola sp.]
MTSTNVSEKVSDLKQEAADKASSTTETAKEQAAQVASAAKEQAGQVAGTARDEAQNLAAETKDHARALLDESLKQVEEQSHVQRDRLVDTLRNFGEDLEQMASSAHGGVAADLTRQVADKARQLSSSIDGREPRELLDDVKTFAQRRPGTFLLGALAAGVVAGRLVRGAKDAPSSPQTSNGTQGTPLSNAGAVAPSPVPADKTGAAHPAAPVVPPQGGDLL